MSDMSMETEHITDGNRFIVDGIITKGLNLLVAPKEKGSSFALGLALCVAGGRGFLDRKTRQGRVFYFALENCRDKMRHKIANIMNGDADPANITFVYIVEAFGDNLEDGMDIYLQDNPKIKLIVIDSLEKMLEKETGRVGYDSVYGKLCAIKKIAHKYNVAILIETYTRLPENSRLASVADTVLDINKSGRQNEYTLHVAGKNIPQKEIAITFETERYSWKPVIIK